MLEGFDESTSWFDRLMRRFKRAGTAVVRIVADTYKAVAMNGPTTSVRVARTAQSKLISSLIAKV